MDDDRYYQNERALAGLDAWITREPEYDEGPPEPEPCCPVYSGMCQASGDEQCDMCNGCFDCGRAEVTQHRALRDLPPVVLDDDERCPF